MHDNCHLYRASNLFYEPRFDRDWLNTIEVSLGGGKSESSRNKHGTVVPLSGTFHIMEANLLCIQNIIHGLFVQAHMPVRSLRMNSYAEHSECSECARSNAIILPPFDTTAQGDLTMHLGYAYSYQENKKLDFIDFAARCGVLAPTGTVLHVHNDVLVVPTGYNGHWGFPLAVDLSCGAYEWLTIAAHASVLFFANRRHASHAPVCHTGVLVKADHIMRGIC
jgi:hypothetical protein